MEIQQLYYYMELCRHENFTEAGYACNMTQGALSKQIKKLETELGVTLIRRNTRKFELSAEGEEFLKYVQPLPQMPSYYMAQNGAGFQPDWPIRVNVEHILGDTENLERIPAKIRKARNLPLLFETAVELGRRKTVVEPGLIVPQGYQGKMQYLLPIYLTNEKKPDLALTLTVMEGYYLGNTCLTLEMAYLNARVISRPIAPWLTELVK